MRKLLHLFMTMLVMTTLGYLPAYAQQIHYVSAGDNTLEAAIQAAADGDIIELTSDGGLYSHSAGDYMIIDKTLTIRAADGLTVKPVVRNTNTLAGSARIFEIRAGGNLNLQGLDLDCRAEDGGAPHAKNAIRSRDVPAEADSFHFELRIDDCIIHHAKESAIKAHTYTIGDTVKITNTWIHHTNNEALLFRESTSGGGPTMKYIEVENCTFTNIGRQALYLEFSDPVIRINHCTFDSISVRSGQNKRMIYPKNVTDVQITNSIFTNQGGTKTESITLYGNSSISYCDTFNIATVKTNGSSTIGFGMLGDDPQYTDPTNDDYTLSITSPLLGAADDGWAMGDLRWDPTYIPVTIHKVDAGDNTLNDAISAAADGDIIELQTSGGLYSHSSGDKMIIDKTLTIRARAGLAQKPVIRNTNLAAGSARIFEIRAGGNLTLQGLDLDCRAEDGGAPHAKNAVRSQDVVAEADSFHFELRIEDCLIHDSKEAAIKAHTYTIGDTVKIRNTWIYNTNNEALLFRESTSGGGPNMKYIEVENCTFTNIGRQALYLEFSDPIIRINHCTFDSISVRSGQNKRMIYPKNVTDVQITNSIFTNQGGTKTESITLYGNSSISYCDTFNIATVKTNGSSTVGAGMLDVDPLYNNPANMDYRLATASPVRGAASDGFAMGDLRWEADPGSFILTIVTEGSGLVTLDPPGGMYAPNTTVTLTADPDPGWAFDLWVGNVFPPNANPVTITMTQDETVTARFVNLTPQYTLTLDTLGLGTITVDPLPGEDGTYDQGAQVTLTATPDAGWKFVEWQGAISDTANPVTVTIDSNMVITGLFNSLAPQVHLNVSVNGLGHVAVDPDSILGTYDVNTMVHLTATAALGWEFSGWSGDLVSNSNPDSILLDADKNVSANFTEISFPGGAMEIDTTWDLYDAVMFANNNSQVDSLVLITSGGLYTSHNTSDVAVLAPLTITAKEGLAEKPVITNSDPDQSNLDVFRVFDDFTLNNVVMDGGNAASHGMKYGIRLRHYSGSDSVKQGVNITVTNVDFKDFFQGGNPLGDGHAFKIDTWIKAGNILFENCTFTNFGYEAIRISDTEKWPTDAAVASLTVRNCTFTNIDAEGIRYYSDVDTATVDAPVLIEHITFNNSATRTMYLKNSGGAIVRDIIIANSRQSGHGRDGDLLDAQGNTNIPSFVSDIDTFNVKAVPIKSTDGQVDENTVWGIDPQFEDAANLNYTLLETSHLYGMAHDGEALGDLRWATGTPVHKYLTITVVDSGSVIQDPEPVGYTYDPGTIVTLTAVPDTGWEFVGWGGDMSGNTNPDTITMNADKSVSATFQIISGIGELPEIPVEYELSQNYPNPFNPSTTIKFALKKEGFTTLKVYDITGRVVTTLINKKMKAGYYKVVLYNPNMASGVYFYRIKSGKFQANKKMILVK